LTKGGITSREESNELVCRTKAQIPSAIEARNHALHYSEPQLSMVQKSLPGVLIKKALI